VKIKVTTTASDVPSSFVTQHGADVIGVLSGFDRLRFCGESRLLNHASGVHSYLHQQRILFKNYPRHALDLTQTLRRQTEQHAQAEGVPLLHLNSPDTDKEALALRLAQQHQRASGRLALLSCVESCLTYRLRKNADGLVELRKERAKCLHYYHYFRHEQFGLCYVRLQSWFPFSVRVGLRPTLSTELDVFDAAHVTPFLDIHSLRLLLALSLHISPRLTSTRGASSSRRLTFFAAVSQWFGRCSCSQIDLL